MLGIAALAVLTAALAPGIQSRSAPEPAACRDGLGASWCRTPSPPLLDARLASVVQSYCPRLRRLEPQAVAPQPLSLLGLAPQGSYTALLTDAPEGRVETVLLGRPGQLAVVLRPVGGGAPWDLQVACHAEADLPALELDAAQLDAALRAAAGDRSLALGAAASAAATAVRREVGSYVTPGAFRCRTGPPALTLRPGSRFSCEMELFTDFGSTVYRTHYLVGARAPYVHLVGAEGAPRLPRRAPPAA